MLEGFEEAVLGRSETGWMDSELFVSWLQTVFIPDIEQRQVKKPVILLVDGHKTPMTIEASDICKENGIILYCLLEHASHLIQPCDLRLFASLKESWKIALREWQIEHIGQYVTKFKCAFIFKRAWQASSKVENAVNGFRDAGLFPLDASVVLKTVKMQTSVFFKRSEKEKEEKMNQDEANSKQQIDTRTPNQSANTSSETSKKEASSPKQIDNEINNDVASEYLDTATKIQDASNRQVQEDDESKKNNQPEAKLGQTVRSKSIVQNSDIETKLEPSYAENVENTKPDNDKQTEASTDKTKTLAELKTQNE